MKIKPRQKRRQPRESKRAGRLPQLSKANHIRRRRSRPQATVWVSTELEAVA